MLSEPERVTSYASIPVKASTDWVTCHASTVFEVWIPVFDNIFAIYYIYYYKSKLTKIFISVTADSGKGWANLATANSSLLLL